MSPRTSSLEKLGDEILGYRRAKLLMATAYLGFFYHLESPTSAAALSRKLHLDARACEIALDALTAMGYAVKNANLYRNSAVSRRHLVRGRPGYLGDNLKYQEIIWDAWGELRACLRRGGAMRPLNYWLARHDGFTQEYIRGMDNIARRPAAEIARVVGADRVDSLLDVGAGPGTYSLAFLRANPALHATLLDLPGTLRVTRRHLREHARASARTTLIAADYRRADFGRSCHDMVLFSHVTHDESPATNKLLLKKARLALRPGGRVVIHDFMLERSRTAPLFGALFSAHMLVYTQSGRTYTRDEYRGWMREEGFRSVYGRRICPDAPNFTEILVGTKEDAC